MLALCKAGEYTVLSILCQTLNILSQKIKSRFSRLAKKDKTDTTEEELLCDYENVESEITMNDAVATIVKSQRRKKK